MNLAFKEIVQLEHASKCFEPLLGVINFFNQRKTLFLPLLHKFMKGPEKTGKIYALLTHVVTRFYSMATAIKSAIRAKSALLSTVASTQWHDLRQSRDSSGKASMSKVQTAVRDVNNWVTAERIIRFLDPLVQLQLKMGKDEGDALSFFYPSFYNLCGNHGLWDKQAVGDVRRGYAGVNYTFARAAASKLYAKVEKFDHPLYGVACLLHPINIVKKTTTLGALSTYPYVDELVAVDSVPIARFSETLDEHFEAFIIRYLRHADIYPMNRGDAAAGTWIFRGDASRQRRSCDVDIP